MAKKNGMKISLAKSTYKEVQTAIASYESHMNALHDAEVTMNKDAWYGGEVANKMYKTLRGNYKNSVAYLKSLKKVQTQIKSYYSKASKVNF